MIQSISKVTIQLNRVRLRTKRKLLSFSSAQIFQFPCKSSFCSPNFTAVRKLTSLFSLPPSSQRITMTRYPKVRRDETVVDDYHGTLIADPYRWLEDPDSEETQTFVKEQNEVTQAFLSKCTTRKKFEERMTEMYDYPKYGCPFRYGNQVFYFYNSGLQAQSVLYAQQDLESEPHVLLDPNLLSADGTVSLSNYEFSEDGTLLSYGLSSSGSDWQTVHVLRLSWSESGELVTEKLSDHLKWVKHSSLAWTHDNRGFFYNRFPEPERGEALDAGTETEINLYQKLYFHQIGAHQGEDLLCWEDPLHPTWMAGAELSHDGQFILLSLSEGCDPVNQLYFCNLEDLEAVLDVPDGARKSTLLPWRKVVDNFSAQYAYVANDSLAFTFLTNKDAPRYKVVRVDLGELTSPQGGDASWHDVIGEGEDVLEWVRCVRVDLLLACYTHHVKSTLQIHSLEDGSFQKALPLPIGSVSASSGRRQLAEIFYSFTSFLNPGTIFRCHLGEADPVPQVFREIEVKGFDPSEFQSEQVFVDSTDGTRVPMFIVSKKGSVRDGSLPALLYGYGGFSISLLPSFSPSRLILMRHLSSALCIANLRGGNEYGELWHKGGSLGAKQNCFNDFISCAEYLVKEGITSPQKLCIEGGSNGGLLVAACINQRPDLFGCAVAHVGVMDMLRFHLFTVGHNWTSDYGCSQDPLQFKWLIGYSPLHNIKRPWEEKVEKGEEEGSRKVQYPSTLVLTGDHDDRVVPLHSFKYIATLQHVLVNSVEGESPQTNPLLARIETKTGHGAGRPTKKVIEQVADVYSFMAHVTKAEWID